MTFISKHKQQLNEQEERLGNVLSRIYSNIKTDMNLELKAGRVSWTDIQRIYRPQANDAIRSAITKIYMLSAEKTVEKDIKVPFFLTSADDREIRRLTQSYQDWFWQGMQNEIVKKTAYAFDPRSLLRYDVSKAVLKETFLNRMVGSIQTEVAAIATVTKAKQIIVRDRGNDRLRLRRQYTGNRRIYSAAIYSAATGPRFVWHTDPRELNTCPQCLALDGNEYATDDIDIPIPIESTHPNCRCAVELEGMEDIEVYPGTIDEDGLYSEQLL